jgi:fatty acid desaturase
MAELWDFLIVVAVFWFILRIFEMTFKGPRWRKEFKAMAKRMEKKHKSEFAVEELEGFMVGGLVCLFMGVAMYYAAPLIVTPIWLSPLIMTGGIVLGAVGGALLIAYIVLSVMKRF